MITELKERVEVFEQNFSKVEKESHARLKEVEEAQTRASQLQETIERYLLLRYLYFYPQNHQLCYD